MHRQDVKGAKKKKGQSLFVAGRKKRSCTLCTEVREGGKKGITGTGFEAGDDEQGLTGGSEKRTGPAAQHAREAHLGSISPWTSVERRAAGPMRKG